MATGNSAEWQVTGCGVRMEAWQADRTRGQRRAQHLIMKIWKGLVGAQGLEPWTR